MSDNYDIIIGLEVHVQLATKTKLFCRCSTKFGASPNTQTCPVCLGMPGSLPVMNREAFALGLKTACALNLNVPRFTKWDRKNYYYPDLPKGYQISQFDLPMSEDGYLWISDPKEQFEAKKVGIIRAHLEEDAGKSMHDEAAGKADTRIDLNRTGTPLLEIVSQPDMRSPLEAKAYLNELKLILTYLGVSDCNMQEGSLRVDANVNLHIKSDDPHKIATPIVEIKNMNSFRAVERALAYEAIRQYDEWQETGKTIKDAPKTTRGWDDQAQVTRPQREKEDSSDYRYFPDPDLAPVITTEEEVEAVQQALCELPMAIRERLHDGYGIPAYDADVIVNQGIVAVTYFEDLALKTGDAKMSSNWVQQDVLRVLKERDLEFDQFPITVERLSGLLKAIMNKEIDTTRAKDVFTQMLDSEKDAPAIMQEMGIEKVDDSELDNLVKEILLANPKAVEDLKNGVQKAVGALIGQAKKKNPNIDPGTFREKCLELVKDM
ncbi:Asp-tRNA(Asn)/Glu-tRNA(Gln) amidotransferase GatCAB subunit B [Blastopirellula marina]|uniref:Aspartyl/glutamyl-tRNA(Asn/Gln) amidotransferase subunit B n=1 Tax=Blastopirellula marina TaxID=124 RepID=A0A2S8G3Y0_9BACT|nr:MULTISPECIES: Asp-tRNA(Asn)/Glu-tRNA(Gln) amidotransferase subunit GatB [Pirellulaceae]PQO39156.1 Asp-tRNA(Asn)/Glu-tRNA(Gln) amidotransferase GatCAB subunit B [Blastopirellula marina]RCS55464.1 Asp-tRNA(Asn)/Glu-tRNA(Gln) amidotransferase subunit GatB [Bremerella cremea]